MRAASSFLVLFALIVAIAVAVASDEAQPGSAPAAATASPAAAAAPTIAAPTPLPTPSDALPSAPLQEAVLVEVTTGDHLRLGDEPETVDGALFSEDPRSLYFSRGTDFESASIFRVSLDATPFVLTEVTDGNAAAVSSQGDLGFIRARRDGPVTAHVLTTDGVIHDLQASGTSRMVWSPDGRWLTMGEPYQGEGAEMSQTLVDTETWRETEFARTMPCSCDGGPVVQWSPDSQRFLYSPIEAGLGWRPFIYSVSGSEPVEAQGATAWLDTTHYAAVESRREGDVWVSTVFRVNADTGVRELLHDSLPARPYSMAAGMTVYPRETAAGFELVGEGGVILTAEMAGRFQTWSPDERHILAGARDSECGIAMLIYDARSGDLVRCVPVPAEGVFMPTFSPDSTMLAFTRPDPLAPNPPGSRMPEYNDLFVLEIASGQERVLAEDVRNGSGCVKWSPDSRFIVLGHNCGV